MPMNFPNMKALKSAARVHELREPFEDETAQHYREELANHVQSIDLVESMEIRTGSGWDKFSDQENGELLARSLK